MRGTMRYVAALYVLHSRGDWEYKNAPLIETQNSLDKVLF